MVEAVQTIVRVEEAIAPKIGALLIVAYSTESTSHRFDATRNYPPFPSCVTTLQRRPKTFVSSAIFVVPLS